MDLISVSAFEEAAYTKLSAMAYDYFVGGADDEVTVRENRAAFQRLILRNRVLVDVSNRNLATELLGQSVSMPVLVAPMAFQKLAHSDGELGMARAVARSESILILSTFATTDVEAVVPAAGGRVWFQLYVYRDRDVTRGLVERVEAAGCKALVLTVDVPLLGRRERDVRNRFRLPDGLTARNLLPAGYDKIAPAPGDSGLAMYAATMLDGSLNWTDLEWLRSVTQLPILVKGIVRADDAIRAIEHGAAGIIVSNHGGQAARHGAGHNRRAARNRRSRRRRWLHPLGRWRAAGDRHCEGDRPRGRRSAGWARGALGTGCRRRGGAHSVLEIPAR
jgi:4-hydroxymandelate oxidase